MGDASLTIPLLSFAHSGTYQCKVKKSPGVDTLKMSLAVMGRSRILAVRLPGSAILSLSNKVTPKVLQRAHFLLSTMHLVVI